MTQARKLLLGKKIEQSFGNLVAAVAVVLGGTSGSALAGETQVLVDEELAAAGVGSGTKGESDDDD